MKRCEQCHMEVATYLQLFQHRRVHSIYRPNICNYRSCCQSFSNALDLQKHHRTHTDRRIYMCNICKTKFLYRHHLKLHKCRIRDTKVYHCHLCLETFVQYLSLSHHIRKEHKNKVKKKVVSQRNKETLKHKDTGVSKETVYKDKNKCNLTKTEDSGQKILLKITAGKSMTLISPVKEKKSSHLKHKHKKMKRKTDKERKAAVSVKNGLVLTIRPVLFNSESKKSIKKHTKSRTKLKRSRIMNSVVEQTSDLKLKIRTDQGKNHVILNSETEQKVPKLLVSKRNLENIPKGTINKQSGSVIASKNIVKKYKNKKIAPENFIEILDDDFQYEDKDNFNDTLLSESFPRIKNGIIIHKDKLGNYTSAEQIGKTKTNSIDIPKCKGGIWEVGKTEHTKSAKVKKNDVPKFTEGIWEVMPSPRPDGTPDFLKLRLSPQKPLKLDVNSEILYESSRFLDVEPKSKDILLGEDSDTFETSPATDKDLELGISSVNDSGIEVLSSSSCNRSNGNSVRSVVLDENSPSYFHCEDSLLSFDSPINDSSKYEHSICGKCGGIVMEPNNNTQSPTKCHCDSGSPLHEKTGYIYISPLKDPSVSVLDNNAVPKFKIDEKMTTFVSVASESFESFSQASEMDEETVDGSETDLSMSSHNLLLHEVGKSVFDFNEDEDFYVGKPILGHVKNPLVLNKSEDEKKQELILLADLQDQKQSEIQKKKKSNSKNRKLSRSPRKKMLKQSFEKSFEKSGLIETYPGQNIGSISNKPIIIEADDENLITNNTEDLIKTLKSNSADLIKIEKPHLIEQVNKTLLKDGQDEYGLRFKNNRISDTTEPIIVAIAKTEETTERTSDTANKSTTDSENSENVVTNDVDSSSEKIDVNVDNGIVEQKSDVTVQESVPDSKEVDNKNNDNSSEKAVLDMKENPNVVKEQTGETTANDINGEVMCITKSKREKSSDNDIDTDGTSSEFSSELQENKTVVTEQSGITSANGINMEVISIVRNEREDTNDKDCGIKKDKLGDTSTDDQKSGSIDFVSDKETKLPEEETKADSSAEIVSVRHKDTSAENKNVPKKDKTENETSHSAITATMEDDSLLQIPLAENEKDVNSASKLTGLFVKTAVVMTEDEDSLMTIPVEASNDATVKTPAVVDKKSPLDLFQQQFLSFLSKNPLEPAESDKESTVDVKTEREKENVKVGKRKKRKISGSNSKKDPKELPKFVDSKSQTPSVHLIRDDDSESDFDAVSQSKKRKKSCLKEKVTKKETNLSNSSVYNSSERVKRKSSAKEGSRSSNSGSEFKPNSHIIIVKDPHLENDTEITDSDIDFATESLVGKDRKKAFVKRTPKNSHVNCANRRKHRDFETDDSDFILSDSEMEGYSSVDSDFGDDLFDHIETDVKKWKPSRKKRDGLKQSVSSVNEEDNNKKVKESHHESVDTKSIDSADFRSRRSKRGRKSCCPCCLGSPRRSRKESHQYKNNYKLPKNHEQFIADTVRLFELKAKIHRLFLSLFPECKELITQSGVSTLAFDDLIDDVLSTLKSEIQFEPDSDIFIRSDTDLTREKSVEQILGEHLKSQSVESNLDANLDSSEAAVDEDLSRMANTSSSVVFVPGIMMYSDDSVINTSQALDIPDLEYQGSSDSQTISANLLPPLPHCDIEINMFESTESDTGKNSVVENHVSTDTIQTSITNTDLLKSDDITVDLGSKLCVDDVSLESDPQDIPVSSDNLQTMPGLTGTELGCNSQGEVPLNVTSDTQLCLNNDVDPISENSLEEIVITIDLNAAKVMLCKNPKACMKQLHSKLVRLVWCLLPELQVSPSVYENLENLEFLIDLITMSNSQADVETAFEFPSLFSKVGPKFFSSNCSASNHSENSVSPVASNDSIYGRTRKKSNECNSKWLGSSKQNRESVKRRCKTSEQTSVSKKLKTSENYHRKFKTHLGDQKDLPKQAEAGDKQSSVKVTKKYFSEKSKSKAADSTRTIIVTKKHFSADVKCSEKDSGTKPIIITRIPNTTEKSQTNDSVAAPLKSNFLFELELEGKVADKIDKEVIDKNEKTSNSIPVHSPVTASSAVRTPSPEKTLGGFSPDTKRRSIDKNIFELLQPT